MKIGILGAGAVGGYFGGELMKAGHQVGFVARGETLNRLNNTGLTLTDPEGETTTLHPVPAAETFLDLREQLGGVDVVIIATKALPGNATFGTDLNHEDLANVPIVTTQNSVEVHYLAAQEYGTDRILAGVVRGYLTKLGPAQARLNSGAPLSLNFGALQSEGERAPHTAECAEQLHTALKDAGIRSTVFDDIAVDIWAKAMFVTTTGELGALADQPMGYVRGELREQLTALMREVDAVGRALSVDLPEDLVDKNLGFADQQDASATSSMQRDISAGRPSELDSQVGAICRMGERAGVPTPLHDMVYGVLRARVDHQGR